MDMPREIRLTHKLTRGMGEDTNYLNSLLQKMEDEVLGSPTAVSQDYTDSINACQYKLRELDGTYKKVKHAFVMQKVANRRCKEIYKDKTTDSTTKVKDEEAHTEEAEG